ncbi:TetR/AcrR family transcriptional regulator [Paludibaculum fermentans]|uniref:Helix-turn-helix transcriptional regulator n=1 Tax=Paludibaculum fermentans TaxID=1473598 RepID=A0A7S7NRD7_PALFE|nr:helix-turn-helix domain-containing protein [Paludibaculum fermentans]QOY88363.1 helix-turn-helix transcriptional regulator [Paludibaculum fermentans]
MKVSREQMAGNRRKILYEAARLFKARGFDAVTVADVMKAAGLTHGGFYGHFKSKEDLIAQTLVHALAPAAPASFDLGRYVGAYLSRKHRDDLAGGCPTAGLGSESIRQSPEARAAMTDGLRRRIDLFTESAPGKTATEKRQAAIGSWAAMVGAVILSRLSDDPKLSDEVLSQTRAWLRSNGVTPAL